MLIPLKSLQEMKTKMNSNSLTSVRSGIAAQRLATEYHARVHPGDTSINPSVVVCIDTGMSTTIGGYGHLLDKVKNGYPLAGFTGAATEPVKSSEDIFPAAPYKEVSFRDTLVMQKYDVETSEYFCFKGTSLLN